MPQAPGPLDASVIVCTYNRSASLAHTLSCLASQKVPDNFKWELIIVDNNSSDDTRTVVEVAKNSIHIPIIRYEFEAQQGLSHARNHGLSVAKGNIILFTDDDVCPEADWVEKIIKGIEKYGCDACGGYIAPVWEVPPPPWLTERFYGFLAIRTEDNGPRQLTLPADAPFGANMAFKREVFDKIGLFDISRGRKGNILSGGEEWDLFERLLNSGGKIMYLPDTRVHHKVESFRLKKRYFRRWRFQASRNIAQTCEIPGGRGIIGVPFYFIPQLIRAVIKALKGRFWLAEDQAFHQEIIVWHFMGMINGLVKKHFITKKHVIS